MIIDIDHYSSRGPAPVPGEQQEAAAHGDALGLCHAMQATWAELQAVPSYVEQQARLFAQIDNAGGIEVQAAEEHCLTT